MKILVNIFLKPIYKKILNIINISYVDHKYKRFGREGDGGYVLPINIIEQNLIENFAVLTFGVNDDISFEDQLKDYFENTNFFCFDPTISEPPKTKNNIHFEKLGVSDVNSQYYKTISYFINKIKQKNIILKFDIEGYEWKIINDIYKIKEGLPIIICELHFKKTFNLLEKYFFPITLYLRYKKLNKLLKNYHITFINTNNIYYNEFSNFIFPNLLELTLVSKQEVVDFYLKESSGLNFKTDSNQTIYNYPFYRNDTKD